MSRILVEVDPQRRNTTLVIRSIRGSFRDLAASRWIESMPFALESYSLDRTTKAVVNRQKKRSNKREDAICGAIVNASVGAPEWVDN